MDNPSLWAVIWLALMTGVGIGELSMAGSFFLLPFAVGALSAAIVSLIGLGPGVSFPVFMVVSFVSFLGMRPLARRLDASTPDVAGIGANRLVGVTGDVIEIIPPGEHDAGMVRIGAEEWKANSNEGLMLGVGQRIRVREVRGTRLVVEPVEYGDLTDTPELR
ncbi:MAG: NfeD family protein [Actinomycetota bacterium]